MSLIRNIKRGTLAAIFGVAMIGSPVAASQTSNKPLHEAGVIVMVSSYGFAIAGAGSIFKRPNERAINTFTK